MKSNFVFDQITLNRKLEEINNLIWDHQFYTVLTNRESSYIRNWVKIMFIPCNLIFFTIIFLTVSKTVEELVLEWNPEDPVAIKSLGMSQFELEKIVPSKCHEEFQIGKGLLYNGDSIRSLIPIVWPNQFVSCHPSLL